MAEITEELIEKYYKRFPETMATGEIAAELDRMNPSEAEEYDTIFCDNLFLAFCSNYIKYAPKSFEEITGLDEYRFFKRRVKNLSRHNFYDAWIALVEGRKKDLKEYLHGYIQSYADVTPPYGEADVAAGVLLAYKNAYKGFWGLIKQEI